MSSDQSASPTNYTYTADGLEASSLRWAVPSSIDGTKIFINARVVCQRLVLVRRGRRRRLAHLQRYWLDDVIHHRRRGPER